MQVKSADYRKGINKRKEFVNHSSSVKKIIATKVNRGEWKEHVI